MLILTNRLYDIEIYMVCSFAHECCMHCQLVGLGNFGMKRMRHSIGMMVIDSLAGRLGLQWRVESACKGYIIHTVTKSGNELVLLKPRLFMNENGKSVSKTGTYYYYYYYYYYTLQSQNCD